MNRLLAARQLSRRQIRPNNVFLKGYATPSTSQGTSSAEAKSNSDAPANAASRSAALPGTVLEGLAWLKDKPPPVALPDNEYPEWLWTLLDRKEEPKKGVAPPPIGSREAQRALRKANRKNIKGSNFMKAS